MNEGTRNEPTEAKGNRVRAARVRVCAEEEAKMVKLVVSCWE